jgi:hypothetical protein
MAILIVHADEINNKNGCEQKRAAYNTQPEHKAKGLPSFGKWIIL